MKIFGYEIRLTKAPVAPTGTPQGWNNTNFGWPFWGGSNAPWFPVVMEPFTGAWQRNQELQATTLLSFHALYRCVTLISQDISKMRIRLMEQDPQTKIWDEVERNSPYWPVLIKPNRYQTRIQFFDDWMGSKMIHGNTYVLKERDQRGIVVGMTVLNPWRTKVLVAPDGSVWYDLLSDNLANVYEDKVRVPASEIIHDRYKPLYHPLIGISPIMACYLSGTLGLAIEHNSAKFFANSARPGGVLTAPDRIDDDTAKRLKQHWEDNYTGANAGRVAVLGDGLKFESMTEKATDAQLIEQLKLTAENVCTAFGVPQHMLGLGASNSRITNVEALTQQYYSQCLQNLIESIEVLLDDGLGLTNVTQYVYGTEFDLEALLRMDTATKSTTWGDLVKNGIAAPNEARSAFDLVPVKGGDAPYMQQQNYSLEALAKRDAGGLTSIASPPIGPPPPAGDNPPPKESADGSVSASATAALAERIAKHARWLGA